jgi:hypothetical protein
MDNMNKQNKHLAVKQSIGSGGTDLFRDGNHGFINGRSYPEGWVSRERAFL